VMAFIFQVLASIFQVYMAAPGGAGIHLSSTYIDLPRGSIHLPGVYIHLPGAGIHVPGVCIHLPGAGIHLPGVLDINRVRSIFMFPAVYRSNANMLLGICTQDKLSAITACGQRLEFDDKMMYANCILVLILHKFIAIFNVGIQKGSRLKVYDITLHQQNYNEDNHVVIADSVWKDYVRKSSSTKQQPTTRKGLMNVIFSLSGKVFGMHSTSKTRTSRMKLCEENVVKKRGPEKENASKQEVKEKGVKTKGAKRKEAKKLGVKDKGVKKKGAAEKRGKKQYVKKEIRCYNYPHNPMFLSVHVGLADWSKRNLLDIEPAVVAAYGLKQRQQCDHDTAGPCTIRKCPLCILDSRPSKHLQEPMEENPPHVA